MRRNTPIPEDMAAVPKAMNPASIAVPPSTMQIGLRRLLACAVTALMFCAGIAMATEEPPYQTVRQEGDFEIRQYAPMLIAETWVEGDMDAASNTGFRRIADFIFGNNQVTGSDASAKIAMTAPVTVEPQSAKIAMTAPVTIEPEVEGAMAQATRWRVHFVMPSQYTLATLPKPNNPQIKLREVPEKWIVVHRYSGFNTLSRVQTKTEETLQWIQRQSLRRVGTPQLSRYDPPWILPMFRRNEIMVEIAAPARP
jgi:SOUL heme-binding protein